MLTAALALATHTELGTTKRILSNHTDAARGPHTALPASPYATKSVDTKIGFAALGAIQDNWLHLAKTDQKLAYVGVFQLLQCGAEPTGEAVLPAIKRGGRVCRQLAAPVQIIHDIPAPPRHAWHGMAWQTDMGLEATR